MEQKQNERYNDPVSFANELHEKNKKRIRTSSILLVLLPVVLGLIRWMTDSDKTVFLIIWVLCMFLLAVYLVSVEYYDHVLYRRLTAMSDNEADPDRLLEAEAFVPSIVRDAIRTQLSSDAAEDPEKGGDE